jgi:hypothetical protein
MLALYPLENDYNLQVLASGNPEVVDLVLKQYLFDLIERATRKKFSGMLKQFNIIKEKINEKLKNNYVFELEEKNVEN